MRYVDKALLGTPKVGTLAWKFIDFPLDKVHIRARPGSAEVYGKQSTSWVATYDENYVVVMMVSQAGTGSGTSGPAVRAIWESLYGINGTTVDPQRAAIPGHHAARRACRRSWATARSCRPDGRCPDEHVDRRPAPARSRLGADRSPCWPWSRSARCWCGRPPRTATT